MKIKKIKKVCLLQILGETIPSVLSGTPIPIQQKAKPTCLALTARTGRDNLYIHVLYVCVCVCVCVCERERESVCVCVSTGVAVMYKHTMASTLYT